MSIELKQCPICNANGEIARLDRNCFYPRCVRVEECGFESIGGTTEQEAIDRWNNRPIESELQGEIERLKDELLEVTHGEELYGVQIDEDEDAQYMVPEGIMKYVEEVNLNWHKDREQIKSLTAEVGRLKEEKIRYRESYIEHCRIIERGFQVTLFGEGQVICDGELDKYLKAIVKVARQSCDKVQEALKGEQK